MSILLDWLMQPLGLVFVTLLCSMAMLALSGSARWSALVCLIFATSVLWFASAPVTANALVRSVETLHAASRIDCSDGDGDWPIVVPGAGLDAYVDSDSPYDILKRDTLLRTLHAVRMEQGSETFYVLGGGATQRKLGNVMSRLLVEEGISSSRIVAETSSRSTIENARQLASLLPPDTGTHIRLVTSYLHANRAAATFRAQGFRVCTVAIDPLYSVSQGWVGYLPFLDGLVKSTMAWREVLATWSYRWRGYTSDPAQAEAA